MGITIFLLFLSIASNPSSLSAQTHPGFENFNLSSKDEAEILFARGRYEEAIEKFKTVLKLEGETSYLFRTMLKSWKALSNLDGAENFFQDYQVSHKDSSHIWYALGLTLIHI